MDKQTEIIADFVKTNGTVLAMFIRQKLNGAGASGYLATLGKDGIDAMNAEAAGVVFELACALYRRIDPTRQFVVEEILSELPAEVQSRIRLPRSAAYHKIKASLKKDHE